MLKEKLAFTKSKWYNYVILGLNASIGIIIIFLIVNILILDQFKPIANLQFEESEWIKVNSANLYTRVGEQVITPNDEIRFYLNVTNKVPYEILIEPEFHTFQAGELKDVRYVSSIVYGFEQTERFQRNYFPTLEGLNNIQVVLKISHVNGTFITYPNATAEFEVLSKTDELQLQQNFYFLIGIFASVFIGAGTIIALAFSVHYSRKEVNQLESNNELENRPWIGVTKWNKTNSGNWELSYKNYGMIPPKSLSLISISQYSEITKERLEQEKINSSDRLGVIFPNSERFFRFNDLHQKITDDVKSKKHGLWVGVVIDYEYKSKHGKYSVICKYAPEYDNFSIVVEWTDVD